MSKRLVFIFTIVLVVGNVAWSQVTVGRGTIEGQVLGILQLEKTKEVSDFLSSLTSEKKIALKKLGWQETKTHLEREGGLKGVTVSVADHKSTTDKKGNYRLTDLSEGEHTLTVSFRDEVLSTESVIVQRDRVRKKNIYAVHFDLDKAFKMGQSEGVTTQSHLPCLDCNGPWGDCKKPGHVIGNQWGSGGLNFVLSDCDQAYFRAGCWRDHTRYRYCNGSRNCSPMIGHSSYHHCH